MKSVTKSIQSVRKFYFLEYYFVLLESIKKYNSYEEIFDSFKSLKQKYQLGESKYKKLTSEQETLTRSQLNRYRYTFDQVIEESKEFKFIYAKKENIYLTDTGNELLKAFKSSNHVLANNILLRKMEERYNAFRHLINLSYNSNKSGLLIFPVYSPLKLGFERNSIKTTEDIIKYSYSLVEKLEEDIKIHLKQNISLTEPNNELLTRLMESKVIHEVRNKPFEAAKYNAITKRFRDFWMNFFLKNIYKYEYSMASFDIWAYRGKQLGVNNITEFYPNFSGRIVYSLSVLSKTINSEDFLEAFTYSNGEKLFIHRPSFDTIQDKFIDSLVKAYFQLRRTSHSYFINLMSLRELVCYNLKITEKNFDDFLGKAYKLNLANKLRIRISLEVDKLPSETKAMYLKQEPVLIDNKYRNIIALDVTKREKR